MRRSEGTPSGKGAKKNCSAAVQRRVLPCAASRCALTSHALEDAIPTPRTELHRGPCGCALRSCAQQQNAKRRPSNSEHTTPPASSPLCERVRRALQRRHFLSNALCDPCHTARAPKEAPRLVGARPRIFSSCICFVLPPLPLSLPRLAARATCLGMVDDGAMERDHLLPQREGAGRPRRGLHLHRVRAHQNLSNSRRPSGPHCPQRRTRLAGHARGGGGPVWDKGVGLRCLLPARREGPRQVSSNDTERGSRTSLFIRCVTLDAVAP